MSFKLDVKGRVYAPGYFLVHDECTRKTYQIAQDAANDEQAANDGLKIVKCGTPYPANDATCIGLLYEDVDVTSGDMPGSVVTRGEVYEDRLPEALDDAAKTALTSLGFIFA